MKKCIALLVLALAASLLGACDSYSNRDAVDYGTYVKSLLDLDYKGITDQYLELVDDTKENAESFYPNCMESWAYVLAENYQLYAAGEDEEVYNALLTLTKDIFSHVKYEVAEAVKSGDYYTVEVTLYPMRFTEITEDEIQAYQTEFNSAAGAGEFGEYGSDEADTLAAEIVYAEKILGILEKSVSQIEYADPVSKIVKITKDEDGFYGISDADYADLENYLIQ